jgi:hypothetical protein
MNEMEIHGSDVSNPEVFYKLQLPFKSVFHDSIVVSDDKEKKVFNEDLKNEMVKKLVSKYSLENNLTPTGYNDELFGPVKDYVDTLLAACPLPRNQGPVIPGLENGKTDFAGGVLYSTYWRHVRSDEPGVMEKPKCGKWTPTGSKEDEIFPLYSVELTSSAQEIGPYSDLSDMAIVYTCDMSKCAIKCACKLCSSKRNDCRRKCGYSPCKVCILQCPRHKVELERTFNHKEHAFTVKVDVRGTIKFLVKHAGIPKECEECSDDLKDHRVYHKVFHGFCKYCRQLMIPFNYRDVRSYRQYVDARKSVLRDYGRTCAFCNKVFYDTYNRQKHEVTIHEGAGKFSCDECARRFANINDLQYHKRAQHSGQDIRVECDQCDQYFKNESTMKLHKLRKHSTAPQEFTCNKCDSVFTARKNLIRHEKEQHWMHKVNWEHVQFPEDELLFKCEICAKSFKRKLNLVTHKQLVHNDDNQGSRQHTCELCCKVFSTKSNCKRHQKQCSSDDKTRIVKDESE